MSIPPALKNRDERDDHQREGDERKQDVRDQDREINPGDEAGVARGFFAGVKVISDVADEETGGGDERDNHARDVPLPDVAPDPEPARRDKNGADRVQ